MDIMKIIKLRHSVRSYKNDKIEGDVLLNLQNEIELCNKESGLSIQLILNDAEPIMKYKGNRFENAVNYIILKGEKNAELKEKCGYFGERIVLFAQNLGLNTCWIAGTYKKKAVKKHLKPNEQLVCIISIGYGATSGKPHINRSIDPLCKFKGHMPKWFQDGLYSALDAPTALNGQRFQLVLVSDSSVHAKTTGGVCRKINLGIVKYHFEQGAGKENFKFV